MKIKNTIQFKIIHPNKNKKYSLNTTMRRYRKCISSVCKDCGGAIRRSPSIHSVCKSCKKEYNGDWLGAVNIVRRFFYYMSKNLGISESCPKQGKDDSKGSTIAQTLVEELAHHGLMVRPMRI
ncbi:MAG: hypothetical protein KGY50_01675 [Candidatus Thermoplasmatota archaeon]|nr:hypothetical protein [Candidatus Thermoplasmatota archaeon]